MRKELIYFYEAFEADLLYAFTFIYVYDTA